jgi:hypothetical protein
LESILSELPSSEHDEIRLFKRQQNRRAGAQGPEGIAAPDQDPVQKRITNFEESLWERGQLLISVHTVRELSQSNCTPVFQKGRANDEYLQNFGGRSS